MYGSFEMFTIAEIKNHIAIYNFNGLNISPRFEYKFKSSTDDPIDESDLCYTAFGNNAMKRQYLKNICRSGSNI